MNALLRPFRNISGAILAFLLPLAAWAQTSNPNPVTLGVIKEAASRTSDKSREALISIFGEVVNDPLAITGGTGDTVLASIFKVTNGAMCVIGAIFICYILFNRLANTAHDGAVFDRDKMTLWEPIRVVWGFATLVPTVNGWSLAQLLMLWAAAIIGVGTANLGVDEALAAFEDGKSMVVQPVAPDTIDLSRNVFESYLCMHGINALLDKARNEDSALIPGGDDSYIKHEPTSGYGTTGYVLKNASFVCGGAEISQFDATLSAATSTSYYSKFWHPIDTTIGATDVYRAHVNALNTMQDTLSPKAAAFVEAVKQRQLDPAAELPRIQQDIHAAANKYEETVTEAARALQGDIQALAQKIQESIKDGGWWMLGAWYQTFAQANTKMADVVAAKASTTGMNFQGDAAMRKTFETTFLPPYRSRMQLALSKPDAAPSTPGQPSTTGQQAVDNNRPATGQESPTDVSEVIGSVFLSPGKKLVAWLTDWDDEQQVNPIIRMKNLGDILMTTSEGVFGGWVVLNVANEAKDGWYAQIVDQLLAGGLVSAVANAIVKTIGPIVTTVLLVLFLLGVTLAVYIPLVPFIVWFGAIINWLVVVGEAVVAAPLWAMIHLAGEGDGFGHKTSHGYIFLLNCMVRPILMVIGFFLGGAAVVVGGTVLNQMFKVAFVNVQFDSMTGIFTLLAFLGVYVILFLNLVHSCFNLIFIVPDQVINWVGGHASPAIGRDENDRAQRMFGIMTSRTEEAMKKFRLPASSKKGNKGDGIKKG